MTNTTSLAQTERAALADLLDAVGPDAPTLCEGWRTRHLAAHLVVREGTLVASAGIAVKALASRHEAAVAKAAAGDYAALVSRIRSGPPVYSMFRIAAVDTVANGAEYYIHHEDVRRAADSWEPRVLPAEHEDFLWKGLSSRGKVLLRKAPVGIVLRTPSGDEATVREGDPAVTLTGKPSELVLYAYGRKPQALVDLSGDEAAVAAVAEAAFGL